ncbi:MAG: DUF2397 domain-containing protein, partial [Firmicutes bacterium]|nr:DUF2397 domain-containing protein [Bacillota bacterium]
LRSIISSLQRTSAKIEEVLQNTEDEAVRSLASQVADHQLSVPRMDARPSKPDLENTLLGQWHGLKDWFLGVGGRESDPSYLQNETNETIRRITRFAQRLGERNQNIRSRYSDYLYLADWFSRLESIEEAHRLSACVFGVPNTRHFVADSPASEDIHKVDSNMRRVLLGWIDRCMTSSDLTAKTETGRKVEMRLVDDSRIALESDDGVLEMPNYEFRFKG